MWASGFKFSQTSCRNNHISLLASQLHKEYLKIPREHLDYILERQETLLGSQAVMFKWCSKSHLFGKQVNIDISNIFLCWPNFKLHFSPKVMVFQDIAKAGGARESWWVMAASDTTNFWPKGKFCWSLVCTLSNKIKRVHTHTSTAGLR